MKFRFARRPSERDAHRGGPGTGCNQRHIAEAPWGQKTRSRAFDAAWALWTALFGAVIPLLWLVGTPQPAVRKLTRVWARGILVELAWIVGLTFEEQGRDHVPNAPCLIVCNHQSTWETLAALVLFPDVAIVAKRELLRIPILGWFLRRSPMIIIDRDAAASALRTMKTEGAAALAAGRSLLIFPEGTRSAPSEPIQFKRGVELLYKALGVPVLPMVVDSGRFWGLGRTSKRAGTITVSYLAPIEPGLDPLEFARLSERLMQAEKERLLAEH